MIDLKKIPLSAIVTIAAPKDVNRIYNQGVKLARKKSPTEYLMAPILEVPAIKQHRPSDCILVCVLAIARYYGVQGDEEGMIRAYGDRYSDEKGSTFADAQKFLNFLGFNTRYIGGDLASLNYAKRNGHPVLYDFRVKQSLGHAVVFLGSDGEWSYWMDPYIGKYMKLPTRLHYILEEDCAVSMEVWPGNTLKLSI